MPRWDFAKSSTFTDLDDDGLKNHAWEEYPYIHYPIHGAVWQAAFIPKSHLMLEGATHEKDDYQADFDRVFPDC